MGLSKSNRVRNSARQVQPDPIVHIPRAVHETLARAVRLCVGLQGMQKQLQKTALDLQKNPAHTLSVFQKMLSRPSYFLAPEGSTRWVVLFGPKKRPTKPSYKSSLVPLQRFIRRVMEQSGALERNLSGLQAKILASSYPELARHRSASLRLARKAKRYQARLLRLSTQIQASRPLYGRMLGLHAQRFQTFYRNAEDNAYRLRQIQRLHEKAQAQPALASAVVQKRSQGVTPQPALLAWMGDAARAVHQWLMHPLIDTRESS